MDGKKYKRTSSIVTIIIIALLLGWVIFLALQPSYGKEVSLTEFETMVDREEVSDVYAQGGTARIRIKGSEIEDAEWPNSSDYYVQYTDISYISSIIDEYNDKVEEANIGLADDQQKATIDYNNPPQRQNFISSMLPYISIAIMLVLGYYFIRIMRSASKGGSGGFGKTKARIEKSNVKFDDVAGADEEKEETREIVEFLKTPEKFRSLGARIPKGILLVGPPGTGKTLLAKAVAGESEVPFFSISGSDFVELYIGVGASRVRDLFETAKKNAPCILFIDEIDAVGRKRGAGLGGGNDEREQTLNQLLVEMDGFTSHTGIVVIAATNRADILDPALLRPGRFDRQIYVNLPDVKGREGIIKIHAKNKPIDPDVDYKALARLTSGFTGADIENFLNEAAIFAARKNHKTITMDDISEGIHKAILGPQKRSSVVTERDKRITAFHESGHAIVSKMLNDGDDVHEVSIIPRGQAGGYTSFRANSDDKYMTYDKLLNKICADMGGRVAEEVEFGEITTGASSDIKQATNLARRMVTEWGMSDLGFVCLSGADEVFIGRDYQTQVQYSETTATKIDEQVNKILSSCYNKAKKCLTDNKNILTNMANLLLAKETIYAEEVDMIMSGKPVDEIVASIDEREKTRKERDEKKAREQEFAEAKRMQQVKLQAATALNKAGILSTADLEIIQKEAEELAKRELEALKKEEQAKAVSEAETQNEAQAEVKVDQAQEVVIEQKAETKKAKTAKTVAEKATDLKPKTTKTAKGTTKAKSETKDKNKKD